MVGLGDLTDRPYRQFLERTQINVPKTENRELHDHGESTRPWDVDWGQRFAQRRY